MFLNAARFIWTYLNKFITLAFFALFVLSFFINQHQHRPMFIIYIFIALLLLNLLNLLALKEKGITAFFEAVIYEAIAILGICYVSGYYVLVFALVAQVIHYYKNRTLPLVVTSANSIFFIIAYLQLLNYSYYNGFYIWHMLVAVFVTVALSIYLVKSQDYYSNEQIVDNYQDENYQESYQGNYEEKYQTEIEHKYNELLKEHQEVVLLKDIMDFSNRFSDIEDLIKEVNYKLLQYFEHVDFSSILLYDDSRKSFNMITSNIPSKFHNSISALEQIDEFADVINEKHGKMIKSEFELKYSTASERGIRSAFCVPLHTNKELIGLIFMESQESETFNNIDINKFNLIRYNISLIVENKQWVERIEKMALLDGLTGVYNRNYLFDFLEKQMKWHKENGKSMCLILYDIDHFKKFNDTYGHLFGDLVLKNTSNLVKGMIRENDVLSRYGGEEFIVVLIDTEKTVGKFRIEEIRKAIEHNKVKNEEGTEANVTVSFGLFEYKKGNYDLKIKDLIERADQALYKSKQEGRNRVTVYEG